MISPPESGREAPRMTGDGTHEQRFSSFATHRAASDGAQDLPAITISRYSSARALESSSRRERSVSCNSPRCEDRESASWARLPRSSCERRAAIVPTALSSWFLLSKSLSRTLTHKGRKEESTCERTMRSALVV